MLQFILPLYRGCNYTSLLASWRTKLHCMHVRLTEKALDSLYLTEPSTNANAVHVGNKPGLCVCATHSHLGPAGYQCAISGRPGLTRHGVLQLPHTLIRPLSVSAKQRSP